jgi:hypothetical protein
MKKNRQRPAMIADLPAEPHDFLAAHALKHPNDRSAWTLLARKFGVGTKYVHRQGIYWKKSR